MKADESAVVSYARESVELPPSGLVTTPIRLSLTGPTAIVGPEVPLKHEAQLVSILPAGQPIAGSVPAFVVWSIRRSDE
jgi:hypothetical protein